MVVWPRIGKRVGRFEAVSGSSIPLQIDKRGVEKVVAWLSGFGSGRDRQTRDSGQLANSELDHKSAKNGDHVVVWVRIGKGVV